MERISVSFSISDNFAQHMAVLAASILVHSPEDSFVFHVLAKELSGETKARLAQMEAQWEGRCRFAYHFIDRTQFDGFPLPLEHITQEAYYRYLLPELLPEERRTIYMDVDILAQESLAPLWRIDLQGCLVGAVSDGKKRTGDFGKYLRRLGISDTEPYYNSGVLVMDLEALRSFGFGGKCMARTAQLQDRLAWPDQDVINLELRGRILALPPKYNCLTRRSLQRGERPVLRHFASFTAKPWCNIWKNRTWPLYLRYLRLTPWRDRAAAFVWAHVKGFFWFRYTKKGVERTLLCGLLVWRRNLNKGTPA